MLLKKFDSQLRKIHYTKTTNKSRMTDLKKEIKKLKEKIICLESDACNEVSQAQYDDMEEDFKEEIKNLKEKLEKENKDYLFDVIDNTGFDKDVFDEEADFDIEVFIHNVKNKLDELTTKKDKFKELFMKEKKELKKVKKEVEKLKDDLMRDELDVEDVEDANLSLKELIDELREENKKLEEYKKKIVDFKKMLKDTTENDSDYDTWDIIEKTLKIDSTGDDISDDE